MTNHRYSPPDRMNDIGGPKDLMRHALFVAFHFPPEASSSGVLRTLKHARYLADFGWRVTVIAPEESAYRITDPGLLRQIPASVRIVRTRYFNTKRDLSIRGRYLAMMALPDAWIGWLPFGVAAGHGVYRADPFDLIYSTSPHATAHLIARHLARVFRRPWVVDFRDPWFQDVPDEGEPSGRIFRHFDRMLEASVVARCSQVVASTNRLRDTMRQRYPEAPAEKFVTIVNGYDDADFAALPAIAEARAERLTIVHAGALNSSYRDARLFIRAVRHAADEGHLDPARVLLRFVGAGTYAQSEELTRCVVEARLEGCIEFRPRVPYKQALTELSKGDLLLLLQASEDAADLVPAKLYEYLRAGRPVLAVVTPGATNEVLEETGGGWAVDPRDATALTNALAEAYQDWVEGTLGHRRAEPGKLRRFDRRRLASELAMIFDRLVASGRRETTEPQPPSPL